MAVFKFRRLDAVGRLKSGEWSSELEKETLIKKALGPSGTIDPDELIELLLVKDTAVRKAALVRIHSVADLNIIDALVEQAKDLPHKTVAGLARVLVKVLPEGYHQKAAPMMASDLPHAQATGAELMAASRLDAGLLATAEVWMAKGSPVALRLAERLQHAVQTGQLDVVKWWPALERVCGHPSPEVRRHGWLSLSNPNDDTHVERLLRAAATEPPSNQQVIWQILGRLARSKTVDLTPTVVKLLGHDESVVRQATVQFTLQVPYNARIIRGFVQNASALSDWQRAQAFESMAPLKEAMMPVLMKMVDGDESEGRLHAIALATRYGDDKRLAAPLLESMAQEKDWWARAHQIQTLGQMAEPTTFKPLARLLDDRDTCLLATDALCEAARVSFEHNQPQVAAQALAPLEAILISSPAGNDADRQDHARLRQEIIAALAHVQHPEVLKRLLKICRDESDAKAAAAALEAASEMAAALGESIDGLDDLKESVSLSLQSEVQPTALEDILMFVRQRDASALYLSIGKPPMMRVGRDTLPVDHQPTLEAVEAERLIRPLLSDQQAHQVATTGALSCCHEIQGAGRYRANIFVDHRGVNAVFRVIPEALPTLDQVGLPAQFAGLSYRRQGLVLLASPRGEGKTTTAAALTHHINTHRRTHIICLENPSEYIHTPRQAHVTQRQIDDHSASMQRALIGAMRQDPDVIVIDELRSLPELQLAMRAASSGQLVIATVTTTSAQLSAAIGRMLEGSSPETRHLILTDLAQCLLAAVAQRLVPEQSSNELVAALEIVFASPEIQTAVRNDRLEELETLMGQHRDLGMQSFDDALMTLAGTGRIAPQTAYRQSRAKERFEPLLGQSA